MLYENDAMSRRAFCAAGAAIGAMSMGVLAGCSASSDPEPPQQEAVPPASSTPADPKSGSAKAAGVEDKLYIVDTIKPKPGDGKAFLDDYMSTYAPLAEGAGMTLVACVVAPPIWIDTDSNIVQVTWTVDDIAQAAWAMNSATRYNPSYVEWWRSVRERVVERDRSYYASESYLEVLNNV